MKYFAVLLLVGLAVATTEVTDDFLNEHAGKFLTVKRTTSDKDDAYVNLDAVELVRSLGFCSRNHKMVGLDTIGPCLTSYFKHSQAAPRMMQSLLKKQLGVGKDVEVKVDIVDDSSVTRDGQTISWNARGTIVVNGQTVPYHRTGQVHFGKGSVTAIEDISSKGGNYQFSAAANVHVDFNAVKDQSGNETVEVVVSGNNEAGLSITTSDGSNFLAEYLGQLTIHAHSGAAEKDYVVSVATEAAVSSANGYSVHTKKSDGTITHVHSSSSAGLDVIEHVSVTQSNRYNPVVYVEAGASFAGRGAHISDKPDYRSATQGGATSSVKITPATVCKYSIAGHDTVGSRTVLSDYQDNVLATVNAGVASDDTFNIAVDLKAKTLNVESSSKFDGAVGVTPASGSAVNVNYDGTLTGSLSVKLDSATSGSGHAEQHLDVTLHTA